MIWRRIVLGLFVGMLVTLALGAPQAHASCAAPNLLIVLDRSCSMDKNNKWKDAVKAVHAITNRYKDKLTFGLVVFAGNASTPYGLDKCFADGAGCIGKLQSTVDNLTLGDGTNQIAAITAATGHIRGLKAPLNARKTSIMFLTDGHSKCADGLVSILRKKDKVLTYAIGFGAGISGNCLNAMAVAGGTALSGSRKYFKASSLTELNKAMGAIATAATKEVCNNNDDDCDGLTDEDLKEKCQGKCGAGTRTCNAGQWSPCQTTRQPAPETCDNKDEDCDGKVDNGLKRACKNGCGDAGEETCKAGKWSSCSAPSSKELCNGKDDDCDGSVDEALTQACTSKCGKGTKACLNGTWGTCSAREPSEEVCDTVDNDCNGKVDDNIAASRCSGKCVAGRCQPKCNQGECSGGKICQDGLCVDKPCAPACQQDERCRFGQCVPKDCTKPDGECPSGELCLQKKCVPDPCRSLTCAQGQFCRKGKCIHSCAGIECPAGEACRDGACQPAPCGGSCREGTSCKDDKCVPDTCDTLCSKGQVCRAGGCVEDPCLGVQCSPGQSCTMGECYGDTSNTSPKGPTTPPTKGGQSPRGSGGGCVCSTSQTPKGTPLSLLVLLTFLFRLRRCP